MVTGEIQNIKIANSGVVYGIDWAPNDRDLLVVTPDDKDRHRHKLFLVDTSTSDLREIKTNTALIGTGYWGIDWSDNGQYIALGCPTLMKTEPTINTGQLCIIKVEEQ